MSDDKEKKGIIENLSAIAQEFILTQSRHPRAYHWKAEDGGTQIAAVLDAVEHGLKTARPDDAIVVTGSLLWLPRPGDILMNRNHGTDDTIAAIATALGPEGLGLSV